MDEIIGWIGAGLIVLDYFLLSTKKVSSSSKIYHTLNLLGAIGIGINAYVKEQLHLLAQIQYGL